MRGNGLVLVAVTVAAVAAFWPGWTSALKSKRYSYDRGPVWQGSLSPCPGVYCGRHPLNESHLSACGPCPRGFRVLNHSHSLCQPCQGQPRMYDWFFLAFHFLLVTVLHWIAIDYRRRRFTRETVLLHAGALLEVSAAALLTVLASPPFGQLRLHACPVRQLADWYPFLHNPQPNYEETLHCAHEVVYPFMTLIVVFYALCLLLMLLVRPLFMSLCCRRVSRGVPQGGRPAIYAALYFLPVLTMVHLVGGGLVYSAYPYIVFVLSLVSSATHFAMKLDQSSWSLFAGCFKDSRDLTILIGHWLLHAFGLLAITQLNNPKQDLALLLLVPLPAIFYIVTAKFTDPSIFCGDMAS